MFHLPFYYLGIFSANIFLSFYLHLLLCLSILLPIFGIIIKSQIQTLFSKRAYGRIGAIR